MSKLAAVVLWSYTESKKSEAMVLARHVYGGAPAVLKARLEVAKTPAQVVEIFESWCIEAKEPPK